MHTEENSSFSFKDTTGLVIDEFKGKLKICLWEGPGFRFEVPADRRDALMKACGLRTDSKGNWILFTQPPGPQNEESGTPAPLESIEITIFAPKGAEICLLKVDGAVEIEGEIDGTLMIYAMTKNSNVYCRGRMREVFVIPWADVYVGLKEVTDKLMVNDQGRNRVRLGLSHCQTREIDVRVSGQSEILLDGTVTEKATITAADKAYVLVPSFTGDSSQLTLTKGSPEAKIKVNGQEV